MDRQELWAEVQRFYREKYGTSPELVDFAADYDILRLSATGVSNQSMADFLGVRVQDIQQLIEIYFGFQGWRQDLPFSPLKIYKELDTKTYENLRVEIISRFGDTDISILKNMWLSCELVSKLERILDEKWI